MASKKYTSEASAPKYGEEEDDVVAAPSASERKALNVGIDGHGQRLDRWLAAHIPAFSRSHLQTLIEAGRVGIDGVEQRSASRRLKAGEAVGIELVLPERLADVRPEPMALAIVFEDEHLLVLDKPAGLVVHPAPGHWSGTLMHGLLAHHADAVALPRAGIVHRLDKDTSGLMVIGKTLAAVTALARAIAAREVARHYLALVHGRPRPEAFSVDAPIGRDPVSRVKMAVAANGREARTDVQVLGEVDGIAALECRLHTGRTHQIRVHLAHRGHPLVADRLYGGRSALGLERQALHARRLAFAHPVEARALAFEASLPGDLRAACSSIAGLDA
ncbi:MAG TPA: RluA family pseudouridine synthase [Methylibium sp.]|uniref:RluA family pseudouridine synthase n=1 Tax=Methylibium sp. TaxID=2067992 RepID=UPI002DB87A12|nr:RluA family pseudouridine synthase [Methylibium sp.]HEU4460237.1 RluA family pseudouridine synthase [Methylibium sp.]